MVPQSQQRKPHNSSKVNLIISAVFHGVIAVVVVFFAAREGLLGKNMKKLAVEMVKEKPPEKPKELEKPKEEVPKLETPKVAVSPVLAPPKIAPQAPAGNSAAAPPAAAPPAVNLSGFAFDGGKQVESDPWQIYKGQVEYALRSRWNRPDDIEDQAFVAEVEVAVDRTGRISDPVWKKSSGDKRWDNTVQEAIASTRTVSRPPPTNFPPRVLVRFDVQTEPVLQ